MSFWAGFEKRAAALSSAPGMKGLTSGNKRFASGGVIKPPTAPTVGQTVAAATTPPPLGTPKPVVPHAATLPAPARVAQVKLPKQPRTSGRGVSSMVI